MKRNWWYRFSFLILITVVSILVVIPTAFNMGENSNFFHKKKVNLGLDLQGGLYMILGIDFNKVYRDEVRGYVFKMKNMLMDRGIKSELGDLNLEDIEDPKHSIVINDPDSIEKAKEEIKQYYGDVLRLTYHKDNELTFAISDRWKDDIQKKSAKKSIEVIRNRIDEFGVTEPEIISQGEDRIIVQLPGVKNIERAKDLIGKTAKLEFKMVNDKIKTPTINKWLVKVKEAKIEYKKGVRFSDYLLKVNQFIKDDLPKGFELAFQKEVNKVTNEVTSMIPFLVQTNAALSGEDLQDAGVQISPQDNMPYVSLTFKSSAAKKFEKLSGDNVGKRMAVILDGNVFTAPVFNERIPGGRAQITLGARNYEDSLRQGQDIALVLRAGALPVQLEFLEQRIVGPSLGADSIIKTRLASIIGCVLIFIFILFYYKVSGLIALTTLTLNILFVMACLVGLEATLTLPGIAGIALTIGMAIDANIIIYERIREEIRKGTKNQKSMKLGFDHAFWTIIDANITTALAGICLINFGTGPIRGFAVTLLIGIVATVYTAYFVGKLLFEFYMDKVGGSDLSI